MDAGRNIIYRLFLMGEIKAEISSACLQQRQTGVLAVIEDVCARVGGSTDALLQQLSFSCGGHSLFDIKGGRHSHSDNNIPHDSFR